MDDRDLERRGRFGGGSGSGDGEREISRGRERAAKDEVGKVDWTSLEEEERVEMGA